MTVTLATFMEVLDTSIANIALPHIAGSFGASTNESTWVLTSYLVSNAIVLPISAWLATRFGRKRFYMTCVALFAASSFFCGLAPSLGILVFFRILQGAGGGGLQPSEQAILSDTFPPEKRGLAFSMYGMAVVVAPAIGPTIGGWLTDNYSWRWIFYINVPVSIISLYLTSRVVEDPPHLKVEQAKNRGAKIDLTGLGLVGLGVGALQLVLDKGQEKDWFGSPLITWALIFSVVVLGAWVIWEWRHPQPIVELKLLKNRNFAAAVFFLFVLGMVLYGTTVLLPQFMELLLGYPAVTAGMALAGGGFVMMIVMPIVGQVVSHADPRKAMACGFAATSFGLYYMATHLSLGVDFSTVFWVRVIQVMGLPFVFIPSNVLSYVDIPREKFNQVSSQINFTRNVGGSIGIALLNTFLTRETQRQRTYYSSRMQHGNPLFQQTLNGMAASLQSHGMSAAQAMHQAYARMDALLYAQASAVAYKDIVSVMAVIVLGLVPLVAIMKRPPKSSGELPPAH
ncbi:MAG TPA: DHA2 family efflux MFS transporter permease subunit [Candidatus Aquilonibacter sp.]|nr:DHA2 family efflux MFS transporter permease subunit [Candidatus Aquilonibacter sp.]